MSTYNPKDIEPKWQKFWEEDKTFEVKEDPKKQKFYSLIEFPYPSGEGLHVGHPRPFTAMDIVSRKKRMEGYNVLYPIGFDAFGLPTENFAIKTGKPPAEVTKKNIANFTRQLKSLGYSFDWSRQVDTTDPKYYKWTQWQFLQFFKHGLAYKKNQPINWCPKDKIGLANEEVVNGCCERCGTAVEKRNKEQWMLAITKYADKLLEGLNEVDYIPQARIQQENWIGRSEGAEVNFVISNPSVASGEKSSSLKGQLDSSSASGLARNDNWTVTVFTTRPDTIFGVTFIAVSAELAKEKKWDASDEIKKYIEETIAEQKTADRTEKEKTGIDSGVKAINPVSGEEVPVWITNYVMGGVGTGAIMGVPAHDERDFEFAKKFGLPIKYVVATPKLIVTTVDGETVDAKNIDKKIALQRNDGVTQYMEMKDEPFVENGFLINSGDYIGEFNTEASQKIISWLEEKGVGKRQVNYKLRDWVFSRQRYWGEPIPLVFCENCAKQKGQVVIVHGFGGTGDENWFGWLKKELEAKGYEVHAPNLPNTTEPDLEAWTKALADLPLDTARPLTVVAHSLGGPTAIKFIREAKRRVEKLILVAPTFKTGPFDHLKNEDFSDQEIARLRSFGETALVHLQDLKQHIVQTVLVLSENDPYIPLRVEIDYADLAPRKIIFKDKEHFSKNHGHLTEFPEILSEFSTIENDGWIPLPESELPLTLPKVEKYEPTDNGESPLSAVTDWVNTTCPRCGGPAKRETDTMPNWAGSSWYFLRYADPHNDNEFASMEKLRYWMEDNSVIQSEAKNPLGTVKRDPSTAPQDDKRVSGGGVDWYNGGMEHTVLHLLYSRFWNQFLFDCGLVPTREPYKKRTSHGMILGPDGEKMSKSRGNVINPDEMVEKFGADAFRTYIAFMGPFDQAVMWDTNGLVGVKRFLDKVWALQEKVSESFPGPSVATEGNRVPSPPQGRGQGEDSHSRFTSILHQTIKKVGDDIEAMRFNTAIAKMMELVNEMSKEEKISPITYRTLIQLLSPFAPHMCEELWSMLGNKESISVAPWPQFDLELTKESTLTIAIQINGKVRDEITIEAETSEDKVKKLALASEKVQKWLEGREPKKIIYVKGKLVSIVV